MPYETPFQGHTVSWDWTVSQGLRCGHTEGPHSGHASPPFSVHFSEAALFLKQAPACMKPWYLRKLEMEWHRLLSLVGAHSKGGLWKSHQSVQDEANT
jgi:hypothetical protein